jgi:hypothetical protein
MNKSTQARHKGWEPGYDKYGHFDMRLSVAQVAVPPCLKREFRKEYSSFELHEAHGWDMGNKSVHLE